jgi:predicted acyltransferase
MAELSNNITYSERIVSIDALRGFDMFWILGAAKLAGVLFTLKDTSWGARIALEFEHTAWNGFTFYDLVFPLFLFIVGLAIPFSLSKYQKGGTVFKNGYIYAHIRIITRTIILIFLGFLVNGFLNFDFANMRWPGVLQRIALCYLVSAIIVLHTPSKWRPLTVGIVFAVILIGYWMVMKFVPVPGSTAGNLSPEGNLAGYIDRLVMPGRFCCYSSGDNEGLLTTIPAIGTTLMGVLTGFLLKTKKSRNLIALYIFISGIVSLLLGIGWNFIFPVNKILWTSSYVLFSGGISLLLFALFYWIIDAKGHKRWAFFFIVIGMNAIIIYAVQGIFDFGILVDILASGLSKYMGIFWVPFFLICLVGIKWLFLYFLYKKKIFLKA